MKRAILNQAALSELLCLVDLQLRPPSASIRTRTLPRPIHCSLPAPLEAPPSSPRFPPGHCSTLSYQMQSRREVAGACQHMGQLLEVVHHMELLLPELRR